MRPREDASEKKDETNPSSSPALGRRELMNIGASVIIMTLGGQALRIS
jgi:hypothetical protein